MVPFDTGAAINPLRKYVTQMSFRTAFFTVAVFAAALPAAVWAEEAGILPEEAVQEGPCDSPDFSMEVVVDNVKSAKGTITVDVHDHDPAKFLKSGGKLARLRIPATEGETRFCILVPEAGIYALAVYHDRNANLKLDKTWIGLPAEPFGLSNNPPPRLAVPKHRDSAFEVTGPRTLVPIHLRD